MKLDFNQILNDFEGNPLKDDKGVELTLRSAAMIALRASGIPGDESLSPMAKYELGSMGAAIAKGLDLTTEQVAQLKERIGKVFLGPEIVHAAWDAIEGKKAEADNG